MQQIFSTWYVAYNKHSYIVAKYSYKSVGNEEVQYSATVRCCNIACAAAIQHLLYNR